jgi:HlyD family secretion protein
MNKRTFNLVLVVAGLACAGYFTARVGTPPLSGVVAEIANNWLARGDVPAWLARTGIDASAASVDAAAEGEFQAVDAARSGDVLPRYRHDPATRGDLLAIVAATGSLAPVATMAVGTEVSGQIRAIFADFNDEVGEGEPIAQIDPITFEIAVDQARADLDVAMAAAETQRATIERMNAALETSRYDHQAAQAGAEEARIRADSAASEARRRHAAKRSISAADRERADADYAAALAALRGAVAVEGARAALVRQAEAEERAARSQLDNLEATVRQRAAALRHTEIQLGRTIIRSPIDGVVVDRATEVGQTVAATLESPTLFVIAQDLRDMKVDASIDESEIGRIEPGQRVEFVVDAHPDRLFDGEVAQVRKSPQTMQNVVTYTVVVKARNPDLLLLPGMTANARFIVARSLDVVKVPNAALRFRPPDRETPPGTHVWVESDAGLEAVPVRIGLTDGTETEISGADVVEGMRVVTGVERPRQEPSAARRLIGVF